MENVIENRLKKYNKEYIKLSLGFVLSTLTTPLLSLVDTAVIGQLTIPSYIGGVALGSTIFNTLYWILGFLRVSTSGYSAMAYGSGDKNEQTLSLIRPVFVSMLIGVLFWIFQDGILWGAIHFYKSTNEITLNMIKYYKILIWGAPFVLLNYSMLGWIMGRKKIKECVILQFITNIINIILDIYFVNYLKLEVNGVAYATLISQVLTSILSIIILIKLDKESNINHIHILKNMAREKLFDKKAMVNIAKVNLNLMIRTFCLLLVTNLFMEKASMSGEVILAGNSILFQIQYLMAYIFDGFSNTASVIIGTGIGEKNKEKIKWCIKKSFYICVVFSVILMVSFIIFNGFIFEFFTNNEEVILVAKKYKIWLILFPPLGSIGLVFYGLFTGSANTKYIRNSMLKSLFPFFLAYFFIIPIYKNNGLWISFLIFSMSRSIFLLEYLPKLKEKIID